MTASPKDEDRRLVPRWRQFGASAYLWERRSDPSKKPKPWLMPDRLDEHLSLWREHPSIETAIAVVQSAMANNEPGKGIGAADFLLSNKGAITPGLWRLARHVSRPSIIVPTGPLLLGQVEEGQSQPIYQEIRELKAAVRDDPRRAIAWVELALRYTVLGRKEPAKRAIDAAVQVARSNRFVVRAASRFYVHRKEPDQALALLRGTPNATVDPWLMSAEIAVGMLSGKTPRYAKRGQSTLNELHKWPGFTTELAGALATLEMAAGNAKGARKLFRSSLREPNDNSIAQALWAERYLSQELVDRKLHLLHPDTFEARTMASMIGGDWDRALAESMHWFQDEPFSSRPAQMGSYIACALTEKQSAAIAIVEQALAANPDDPILRNNLIVALAHSGNLARASTELKGLPSSVEDADVSCTLVATQGLVAFCLGDIEKGRAAYYLALTIAGDKNAKTNQARVRLHWAECELKFGDRAVAEILLGPDLRVFIEKLARPFPDLKFVLSRTLSRLAERKSDDIKAELRRDSHQLSIPQL